jgi:EpsD family peptidyl-prolyl cis-trans isomerase
MKLYSLVKFAAPLLALAFVSGCGKKEEAKPTSQVVAKVNADEITVSQVNGVLARAQGAQNAAPEAIDKAKREILDKLIDQQIAKQKAIELKLDRSPAIMQAIEGARNEILARAYYDRVAAAQPKPTPEEVKKYYADHPELFSQRRIFNIEEIATLNTNGLAAKLREQVAKARTMQDVASWLKSNDIKFSGDRAARPAEALPLELLPTLQKLKDGEMTVVESGPRLNVYRVAASQAAPVNEATASTRIQQFLFNKRASAAVADDMKALKDKADVTYLGEFAGGAAAAEAKAKAAAEAKTKELAEAKARADQEAQVKAESRAQADADAQARLESLSKTRAAAEAQAKAEADAKAKAGPSKSLQIEQDKLEKGVRGLR